jgi:transcription initiation factor TFIIE subunit alpha
LIYSSIDDETLLHIARILGGEEGTEIVRLLSNVEEITVEELAEKTGIQINEIRKLLYKFYNHSLVTSRRFRDKETGWFIFQWSLQPKLVEAFVQGMKHKILRKLEERFEHEVQHEFYHCGLATCLRITFEDAMETVFHCPFCDGSLNHVDNNEIIHFLKLKIEELEEDIGE